MQCGIVAGLSFSFFIICYTCTVEVVVARAKLYVGFIFFLLSIFSVIFFFFLHCYKRF